MCMGMPLRGDSIHEGSGSGCEVLHLWLREALRHGAPALGDAGPQAGARLAARGVAGGRAARAAAAGGAPVELRGAMV